METGRSEMYFWNLTYGLHLGLHNYFHDDDNLPLFIDFSDKKCLCKQNTAFTFINYYDCIFVDK